MATIQEKIKSGRQYRNMTMTAAEEKEEGEYIVRGYATTYNEPYTLYAGDGYEVREQVDPDAFKKCDMSDVIFQYDHEGRVFARLSNDTLKLESDSHGLLVEADLGGTSAGRDLYEEIRGGYTTKMSFGFNVGDDRVEEFTEGETRVILRTITEVSKLWDVSAVSLPANDGTEISARTYCDGVIAKSEAERLLEEKRARDREYIALKIKLMEV